MTRESLDSEIQVSTDRLHFIKLWTLLGRGSGFCVSHAAGKFPGACVLCPDASICGLRPDCNAVTVAVESPEEKRMTKNNNNTRTSSSGGGQDKKARKQHRNVSPAAAAANNSATATQARQRDNQRALDEKRKERSRKRSGQTPKTANMSTATKSVLGCSATAAWRTCHRKPSTRATAVSVAGPAAAPASVAIPVSESVYIS